GQGEPRRTRGPLVAVSCDASQRRVGGGLLGLRRRERARALRAPEAAAGTTAGAAEVDGARALELAVDELRRVAHAAGLASDVDVARERDRVVLDRDVARLALAALVRRDGNRRRAVGVFRDREAARHAALVGEIPGADELVEHRRRLRGL